MASNAEQINTWLTLDKMGVAGRVAIIGNLEAESGCDPGASQGGGPGRGIAQWSTPGRWDTLKVWCKGAGEDPATLRGQYRYLVVESKALTVWGTLAAYGNAQDDKTLLAATKYFMTHYEMPADQSDKNAQVRMSKGKAFAGGSTGTGVTVTPDDIKPADSLIDTAIKTFTDSGIGFIATLTNPRTWLRAGLVIVGGALIVGSVVHSTVNSTAVTKAASNVHKTNIVYRKVANAASTAYKTRNVYRKVSK